MPEQEEWCAGIDWASTAHQVCLINTVGAIAGERSFPHDGAGLAAMADWLRTQAGTVDRLHIAIEIPHGPVVESLLEQGFRVYALNPRQLDRFRDRFSVAGAKDDRRDAHVLADAVRTDRKAFRALELADPLVIELREFSRIADDLQQERTRLGNRIREQLWRYYPQMIALSDDMAAEWLLDLWALVPTPEKARRVRPATVARILKRRRIRRLSADDVLERLRAPALTVAPGTIQAAQAHIAPAASRMRLVNQQLRTTHEQLDRLCARLAEGKPGQPCEQRDATILRTLPGVGRIVLATLLAEAWQPLKDRNYHALRTLSGVAPVTRRSGKRMVVVMRQACHLRLRTALYHWARVAVQHDPPSRGRYSALRGRGHSHGRALRSVADRLLNVACAMLHTGAAYDRSRHA